jgi:hypothetical protein
LGVKRQVEDCRRLAASLGWIVAEQYIDNDRRLGPPPIRATASASTPAAH